MTSSILSKLQKVNPRRDDGMEQWRKRRKKKGTRRTGEEQDEEGNEKEKEEVKKDLSRFTASGLL